MTPDKIAALKAAVPSMPTHEKLQVLDLLDEWEKREHAKKCRSSLLTFVKFINPDYKIGAHHKILAGKLEKAARGELDRLATAIAPRFGKSLLLSLYFPAWFMGNFPEQKLIISSHTADLAVDFGKKVRNLIDTAQYKTIFPGVALAADSKSAGRWMTSSGGEFFACIRPNTSVHIAKGRKKAGDVQIGDMLFNAGSPVRVKEVYKTAHALTLNVAGLHCSAEHPIWTMNRGWAYAKEILPDDILRTESFSDRLKALFRRAYGYLEHTRVPALVQHQVALRKSAQREVFRLRRARDFALRTVAAVRQFCCGYGQPAFADAHGWAQGQQRPIQPRELPMGDTGATGKQPSDERVDRGPNDGAARTSTRNNARNDSVQTSYWGGRIESAEAAQEELETYSAPKDFGWGARLFVRMFERRGEGGKSGQGGCRAKGYLARAGERAQQLLGLLVGVRYARNVKIVSEELEEFVNFLTDGDHTFFADGVLTHNCGVGGAVAGRGADLLIVDDPFSEQDILNGNYDVFDKVYEWYAYGARTRLMPGGRVVVLHTRWAKNDLIGQLLDESAKNKESDQWEYIEFPAIINEGTDHEKSLWPDQWSLEALRRTRASMPSFQWQAQYQQSPTSQHGALIKKEWWQKWVHEDPPECDYLIMALDAAQEANKRSDFTALTTWGVFYRDSDDGTRVAAIILLNAINKRMEFPALKDLAMREYKTWQPDCFIIEKKSNGAALAQELRRMGLPIQEYTPSRGTASSANTKYARVNSVADIVRSGLVWAPDYKWSEEVIEQCNDFPSGKHDDLCLAAGTKITLASGKTRRIEMVKVGDFVRTPLGPRRVIAAGQTGVARTVRLRAAGRILEGTGAHRVATAQGWKRLDTMTVADTIKMSATFWSLPWPFLQKMASLLNPFTSTAENIIATQKQSSLRIADTTQLAVAGVRCTEIFGRTTTAQSQMGLMSTTKTTIGTTTQSRTLSAFQSKSTARTTHSFNPRFINALNISRISMLFAQKPQSGTEATKGGHGMQKSLPRRLLKVALRTLRANKHSQSEGKIHTKLCAQNAASLLKRWLSPGNFVPTRVRADGLEESVEKKAVFNLQVEEANCYYANGFLTHNCDTVVMALMRFRSGGFITLPSDDRDDEQPNFRPRRAEYY